MKKGFTLVEILAVIVILGVIMLIAYPAIDNTIKESREKAYLENVNSIEAAFLTYSVTYDLGYNEEYQTMDIQTIKNAGLLKDEDIKNPIDDSTMKGCIVYRWENTTNQYKYEYSAECVIPE